MYPAKPALPHILGRDGVGEVVAVGPGVSNVKAGDTVGILRCDCGVEKWGTLAEKVVVAAASVAPPPAGWSLEQTAGAPLVYLTAWQALTQWSDPPAPPPAGSVLLVTGASGGVGTASVQLGKSMGLTVVALSRSAEKGAKLRAMGADSRVRSRRPEPAQSRDGGDRAQESGHRGGQRGRSAVQSGDRHAGIRRAHQRGGQKRAAKCRISIPRRSFSSAIGSAESRCPTSRAEQAQAAWKEITGRLNAIGQKPVVDHVFAFEDVKQAFARLAEGPMGKVLSVTG